MGIARFRAMTFNIHHGEGRDGRVDLGRTAAFIRSHEPDLVALQELDVGLPRSGGTDQPVELARLLGMTVCFAPAIRIGDGEYGIALAAHDELVMVSEPLPRVDAEERRVAITARWRGLSVVTAHLSPAHRARTIQTEALATLVGRMGHPALVMGDLNQPRRDLAPLHEIGLGNPRVRKPLRWWLGRGFQIDHVLASRSLSLSRARLVPTGVSDHPALVVDVAGQAWK